eukprot:TRINITY_DN66796_c6_g1_i1.p1 TRINITY_DN66796_c6_g1~~TRINITY_DN66796_c6_g1_i1.p1  ORF type:complete len:1113 (+),score=168.70 TRINITY_DN66796_c6_g1_i1:87-3341(+)
MSTKRRDTLREIELQQQQKWRDQKIFELDAPKPGDDPEKYFVCFPYPYMNGRLHLGHGFSLSKPEFAVRFQRMKGKRALWPFGLHVTGMPIAACAQKLRKEVEKYGNPPQFPEELLTTPAPTAQAAQGKQAKAAASGKFQSKKGKKGPAKPQWIIMQGMGLKDDEIAAFQDPLKWLEYFPPRALEDLEEFGAMIDYRRSFITTEQNPFYDSFIRWQFEHLKAKETLAYGQRLCVFSAADGQPCQDHDRESGEGACPQEYTLIKLEVQNVLEQECFKSRADLLQDKKVFLVAATLRPETMFGQTNCWILPTGTYQAVEMENNEVFVLTTRAATNLAWQGIGKYKKQTPPTLFDITGKEMLGLPLSAPRCPYKTVYTLPMHNISLEKGTGVVTSVPSDSPDDYQSLKDLKDDKKLREKWGIKEEWVMPFEVVPILEIPGWGNMSAKKVVEEMGIKNQHDQDKLAEAKQQVYLKGFTDGVMTVDEFKGEKVKVVKPKIRAKFFAEGVAVPYSEPERQVISRSGDECVVAACEQWYLKYGDDKWKAPVKKHINETLNCYTAGTKRGFQETIDWLGEWPCSRTFGLGTRLPFEGSSHYLIDSLSDSTIYMAYYTVAHMLQGGGRFNGELPNKDGSHLNLDGKKGSPCGIKAEQLTHAVWDYIFLGKPDIDSLETTIDKELLKNMRREFTYWYPLDLRTSGKDLIQNHLTMALYNHAAIWDSQPEYWPQSFFCNGHVLVDGEKMAKSKGNFLTMIDTCREYSADATRIAFADAGDGLDDANFVLSVVNSSILKLTKELDWVADMIEAKNKGTLRTGDFNYFDNVFANDINKGIADSESAYSNMAFREALSACWFMFQNARDAYRTFVGGNNAMHQDLVFRFIEVQALILSPICPHFCDHIWSKMLGLGESVCLASWPSLSAPFNVELWFSSAYLTDLIHNMRTGLAKTSKKGTQLNAAAVFVRSDYEDWQVKVLEVMHKVWQECNNDIPKDIISRITASDESLKPKAKTIGPFIGYTKERLARFGEPAFAKVPPVKEVELLTAQADYIKKELGLVKLEILNAADAAVEDRGKQKQRANIGMPSFAFYKEE